MGRCPTCGKESTGRFCPDCEAELSLVCPACGALTEPGHRFCGECGASLQQPPGAGMPAKDGQGQGVSVATAGDAVFVRPHFDASSQTTIGSQTNIGGNVIFQQAAPPAGPSQAEAIVQAQALLDMRSYRQAAAILRQATSAGQPNGEVYTLLVVALLRGENPGRLSETEIRRIEEHLRVLQRFPEWRGFAVVTWAVVKHDRFVLNGLAEGEPAFEQLVREARQITLGPRERALLQFVQATSTVQREEHAKGMVRLLSLALRVLTLVEHVVRDRLRQAGAALTGLYAGNPKRETARPTTERLLRTFRGIVLTIVRLPGQTIRHVTPLSDLQRRILELLGLPLSIYEDLALLSRANPP